MSRRGRVDHARAVEELHEALTARLGEMTTSDDWLTYLGHARKFHRYSPQNQLLLALQGAEGSVAGYRNWQRIPAHGGGTCQVRQGETGLQILAPLKARSSAIDEASGEEVTRYFLRGFRTVKVFHQGQLVAPPDIGQDSITPKLLTGENRWHDVWSTVTDRLTDAGFDVALHSRSPGERWNGQTNYVTRQVLVADDLAPAQQLKTLLHEWAHVSLDHENRVGLGRDVIEVEAESVAYLFGQTIGLDSEVYSVPYIAGWSTGDLDLVAATAHQVLATTKELVDTLQRDVCIRLVIDPLDHAVPETDSSVERTSRREASSTRGAPASTPDLAGTDRGGADLTLNSDAGVQAALFDADAPDETPPLDASGRSDTDVLRALGHQLEADQAAEFVEVIYRPDRANRAAEILADSGLTALQAGRIMQHFGVSTDRVRTALEHAVAGTVDRSPDPLYPAGEVETAVATIDPDFLPLPAPPVETLRTEKTHDMKVLQRVVRTAPDPRLVVELAEALVLDPVDVIRVCESVEASPNLAVAVAAGVHSGDGQAALATLKEAWPDVEGGWEAHAHPSMLQRPRHLSVVPDPPEHDPILDIFAEWDAMDAAAPIAEPPGRPLAP